MYVNGVIEGKIRVLERWKSVIYRSYELYFIWNEWIRINSLNCMKIMLFLISYYLAFKTLAISPPSKAVQITVISLIIFSIKIIVIETIYKELHIYWMLIMKIAWHEPICYSKLYSAGL